VIAFDPRLLFERLVQANQAFLMTAQIGSPFGRRIVAQNGGEAFKAAGTTKSTGTKLLSLDGHFRNPGLYEVDMGTPLSFAVYELGGGFREPVKALHIGGPLGGLVPMSKVNDLTLDFESFAGNGFLLGHASILSIPERFPLMQYIEHLFEFTAHESCGKCFPCRIGSVRGMELFRKAYSSDYRIDKDLLTDLLDTLEKGSLCALGGGIPLPVKNALQYFESELQPYFKN
jgi:NADH-quinone oxidoreductase subunit F